MNSMWNPRRIPQSEHRYTANQHIGALTQQPPFQDGVHSTPTLDDQMNEDIAIHYLVCDSIRLEVNFSI